MNRRRSSLAVVALVASLALVVVACGDDDTASSDSSKPAVKIANQAFGESEIAGQIYGQVLADNGFDVSYQSFKDRAAIYTAIDSGDANFAVEYAASGLEFLNGNKGEASPDITATTDKLNQQLESKGLVALEPSKAVDTNALVVTKENADKNHWTKISDLTPAARLGAPQDCPSNAGCIAGLKAKYGLDLSQNFVPLDLSGPLTKKALQNNDVDVAVIFSSDSAIKVNRWVTLEDDKHVFNADNIIPVVTKKLSDNSELVGLVNGVSAKLTTDAILEMNKKFDIDKEDADAIAKAWIADNGLGK